MKNITRFVLNLMVTAIGCGIMRVGTENWLDVLFIWIEHLQKKRAS